MSYSRDYFTKKQAAQIKEVSNDMLKAEKRKSLTVNREIEDIEMCRELGIDRRELNQMRMY